MNRTLLCIPNSPAPVLRIHVSVAALALILMPTVVAKITQNQTVPNEIIRDLKMCREVYILLLWRAVAVLNGKLQHCTYALTRQTFCL